MQLGFHSTENKFSLKAAFLASGSAWEAETAVVDRQPGQRNSEIMYIYYLALIGIIQDRKQKCLYFIAW